MYVLLLEDYSTCHPSATPVTSGTGDATHTLQLPKLSSQHAWHSISDISKGDFPNHSIVALFDLLVWH